MRESCGSFVHRKVVVGDGGSLPSRRRPRTSNRHGANLKASKVSTNFI